MNRSGFAIALLVTVWALGSCAEKKVETPAADKWEHPGRGLKFVREFKIDRDTQALVPSGCVWAVSGHDAAEGEKGITTADVHIEGMAAIGGIIIEGKNWVTFRGRQTQTLWIYEGSKVGLGDTRPTLTIKEYRDLESGAP